MKTKEELNILKAEVENMNKKLSELSEDELKQVVGGGLESIGPTSFYGNASMSDIHYDQIVLESSYSEKNAK